MNKRKPIFVSTYNYQDRIAIVVVCDDGSIWELWNGEWERVKDIPQDEGVIDD